MKKVKIIFLIAVMVLFLSSLFPLQAYAGLVPCGTERNAAGNITNPCQFCHFFVLFNNIIKFFLFDIVPVLAALMIVIAGLYFFTAGQNPAMLTKAKDILTSTLWGLIIIFGAWIIVNTFFAFIGVNTWTGLTGGWFKINCP